MNSNRLRHRLGKRLNVLSPATTTLDKDTPLIESGSNAPRENSAIASLSGMALTIISLSVSEASALDHSGKDQIGSGDSSISRPDSRNLFVDQAGQRVAVDWQSIEIASGRTIRPLSADQPPAAMSHVVLLEEQEHGDSAEAQTTNPTILAAGDTATVILANGLGLKLTLTSTSPPPVAIQEIILRDSAIDAQDFNQLNLKLLAEEQDEVQETALPPFDTDFLKGGWLKVDQQSDNAIFLEGAMADVDFSGFAEQVRAATSLGDEALGSDDEDSIVATYDASGPFSG
jgi:hypothetical protein